MTSDDLQHKAVKLSAIIYISVSLILAGIFLGVSSVLKYPYIARYGGAVWVFLLSMIITMPTITPLVKKRLRGNANG